MPPSVDVRQNDVLIEPSSTSVAVMLHYRTLPCRGVNSGGRPECNGDVAAGWRQR